MLRRGRGRSGAAFDRDSDARARARSDGFGGGSLREPRMGSSKEGIAHSFDRRAGVVRCALATTGWVPDGLLVLAVLWQRKPTRFCQNTSYRYVCAVCAVCAARTPAWA